MTSNDLHERLLSSSVANNNNNYQSLESNSYHNQSKMNDLQNNNKQEEDEFKSLNILHHSINNTENDGVIRGYMSHHEYGDSQSQLVSKQPTAAISMSNGTQPTNTNVISALRHKASSNKTKPRVDNVFLYSSIPKFGDMFLDYQTSAITLLHIGFAILTIILIVIGYVLNINVVWKYGTFLCLITNIFGITHSMYSGSISSKVTRLDAALQNFALIIQKFAKALNIQEAYLCSVKNILDFLDHFFIKIKYDNPEIDDIINNNNNTNNNNIDYKKLFNIYYEFIEKLKIQTIIQHKKWLLTFFGQYKICDNRFGITKNEYTDFINQLPNLSRTYFQSLTGIHTRFKKLDISDELLIPQNKNKEEKKEKEEKYLYHSGKAPIKLDKYESIKSSTCIINQQLGNNNVLLYKDMTELVYKVLDDIGTLNNDILIQNELAEKMLSKEKMINNKCNISHDDSHIPHGYILSQKMMRRRVPIRLARDAPQVKMSDDDADDDDDQDDDNVYKSLPITNSDLRKIKSFDNANDIYKNSDFVKQRTLSMDDDFIRKLLYDLNDDDDENFYDYSHSHKL